MPKKSPFHPSRILAELDYKVGQRLRELAPLQPKRARRDPCNLKAIIQPISVFPPSFAHPLDEVLSPHLQQDVSGTEINANQQCRAIRVKARLRRVEGHAATGATVMCISMV